MHKRQNGFVSIIVASILMIILTLITIGLSRIMQREQRQSLDRQLSTQAFYAAETAINDVQEKIQSGSLEIEEKKNCDVKDWPTTGANGAVDSANRSVAYTCLIYDSTPSSLEFNNGTIKTQESRIFPVQSKNSGSIKSIKFEWSGAGGVDNIQAAGDCGATMATPLTSTNIDTVPMLRVDLVRLPTVNPAGIDRQTMINETVTTYLYPHNTCGIDSGDLVTYTGDAGGGQTKNGQLVHVDCNGAVNYACSFEYTNMEVGLPATDRYFVRLKSVYNDADVRITSAGTSGVDFEFVGAQTVVDSTGKANDVLRRMKVHLSNASSYPVPEFVFQSMDGVCKQLNVAPGNIVSDNCF